jgi:predicted transcriptional regulator
MSNELERLEERYAYLEDAYTKLEAEREALMTGLGEDPSEECRDEYPPERLHALATGLAMRCENAEQEVLRLQAALSRLADAVKTTLDVPTDKLTYRDQRLALIAAELAAREVLR